MARVLIVGCGCRGQELARALAGAGYEVRGTSRRAGAAEGIEAAGAEPYVGDPDRVGTLMAALEAVTVVCWLLGSADGEPDALAALHGPRLRFFLGRLVDTAVRGFVYEGAGTVDPGVLERGAGIVHEAHEMWEIPVAVVDPAVGAWPAPAVGAIEALV